MIVKVACPCCAKYRVNEERLGDYHVCQKCEREFQMLEFLDDVELIDDTKKPPKVKAKPPARPPAKSSKNSCPYCFNPVNPEATRCGHCQGELMRCPRCKKNVRVKFKKKFMGLLRGGFVEVRKCKDCGEHLSGPQWWNL